MEDWEVEKTEERQKLLHSISERQQRDAECDVVLVFLLLNLYIFHTFLLLKLDGCMFPSGSSVYFKEHFHILKTTFSQNVQPSNKLHVLSLQ